MNNILVISPHPDDESIGCGGTIIKHITNGDIVHAVFLTSGEKGGHKIPNDKIVNIRELEARNAADILQIQNLCFWREPDGEFEVTEKNVKRLIEKIQNFRPDIIYVTHEQEMHPDHQAAALLVRTAFNQLPTTAKKPIIWMYEIWTPLQEMAHIVDISDYIDIKKNAVRAYKSQCDIMKLDEAILGLNRYRGEMHSWPGGDYAEIFLAMKI